MGWFYNKPKEKMYLCCHLGMSVVIITKQTITMKKSESLSLVYPEENNMYITWIQRKKLLIF